jgi:transcriptional repressor NrdR
MRCPYCGVDEDKVVDSRAADEGGAIRRRRECLACSRRYTTYERIEELPLTVVKRSGEIVPFDRAKVAQGISEAAKNRPIDDASIDAVALAIEEHLRTIGVEVSSEQVGLAVLEQLRLLDTVAYLRFASVYKGFEDASDFEREVELLEGLEKTTAPKRHT